MEKFKALMTFMLAFFKVDSLVEDGKINLSDEQMQQLQDALGEKVKLSDVVDAMNQELAKAAKKDEGDNDQQMVDLKKEAMEMLKAHGMAQEDAEKAVNKPQAAAKGGDAEMKQILQGLIDHNKKTDKVLQKLLKEPEGDAPLATGNRKNAKDMHSSSHFLGTGNAWDAFEDRPWNQRAAGMTKTPTDFAAENGTEIQKLKNDVDLYYRENPTEINSLHRDLLGLPEHWNIRINVDDKVADGNIVVGEISQSRKLQWAPKNKEMIQPEESQIFPVHIDIEYQGYFLQQIETSWLNSWNKEGSQPYKMSFVRFLLSELDKKARQEDRKVAINGVYVKTPNVEGVSGRAINRGDGIMIKLWQAYFIDKKFKIANVGNPSKVNIVDYVPQVINANLPEESKREEGLVFYLSPSWLDAYKIRKRELFGLDNNYTGKEKMEIENFPNIRFHALRDLEGSDFMFITDENNIELMENVPGEKSMYHFDTLKRNVFIYADYKWGVRFKHIGTKVKDTDPASFKVQTVWANKPPYLADTSVALFDDTTGEITIPYNNVTLDKAWATDVTDVKGTYAGQVVKITGDATSTGKVVDTGNITLAGNADFLLSTGGTLTLLVNTDLSLTEIKRTAAPVTAPTGDTNFTDSIDATQGSEFTFAGAANDTLDEILNGYDGQAIRVLGDAGATTLTIDDVAGNIEVTAQAVLALAADYVDFVKVDGVWTEVSRNIA